MEIKRKSNFEWLRIIAMAMIIILHYMFKGEMIQDPASRFTVSNMVYWLITSLCICSVNVYVLISGYFLVETNFKHNRLVELIFQVLEYSVIITLVMLATGRVALAELTVYDWIGYVLPVSTEEYWFVTAYLIMYLLSPLLAAGAKSLEKKQFKMIILVLLIFTMFEKSILPMKLPTDGHGYEFGWFIVLYLIAAYIRIYGFPFLEEHIGRAWALYLGSAIFGCLWGTGFSMLNQMTGIESFGVYAEEVWDYNFIFVLLSAIGLFYIFKNAKFNENAFGANLARKVGKLTFGVYLLHEHPLIRYNWQAWLGVKTHENLFFTIANMVMCVAVIFVIGVLVEGLRSLAHGKLMKTIFRD